MTLSYPWPRVFNGWLVSNFLLISLQLLQLPRFSPCRFSISFLRINQDGGKRVIHPTLKSKSKSKSHYDRQSVGQSVLLSETRDQFFFLLEIFFRQLRACYFVAPSLIRGRVCNVLLLLVLTRSVPLGSESRETQDHIFLSQILRLPQPGGPGLRIYTPQEQGGQDIPSGTGVPFILLLRLAGLRWRYSIPPPHGMKSLLPLDS
jgi:hypothetical protein